MTKKIGVLSLQGAFKEHLKVLRSLGAEVVEVKRKSDLKDLDGLIIPGGESTTISKLVRKYHFEDALKEFGRSKPIFGTCAGMILVSADSSDKRVVNLGLIDIDVLRNAYGRQLFSFETAVNIPEIGEPEYHAVFIRAPIISRVGEGVIPLAYYEDKIILARKGNILVSSFHPELTLDHRIHEYFLSMC